MKWIKWLFSLMHVRFWIALAAVPTAALSIWLAPGAAATTTAGILLGILWYVVVPGCCIVNFFYLVTLSARQWDQLGRFWRGNLQEIKDTCQGVIDYFSNWWNSRPNKPE